MIKEPKQEPKQKNKFERQKLLDDIQKCLVLSLFAIVFALFFQVPIYGEETLILSGAAVYIALQLSPLYVVALVFAASSYGLFLSGIAIPELALHFFEFAFVAFLLHQKFKMVVASGIFWVLLATPILWLLAKFNIVFEHPTELLFALHSAMNGILNVGIAIAVLLFISANKSNEVPKKIETAKRSKLFDISSAFLIVPLLIISFGFIVYSLEHSKQSMRERLFNLAAHTERTTDNFLSEHQQVLEQLADLYALGTTSSIIEQAALLARTDYPSFENIMITDSDGLPVFKASDFEIEQGIDDSISTLPSFIAAKESRQKSIERTTQASENESKDIISLIEITIPYVKDAKFSGVIHGRLDISDMMAFMEYNDTQLELIVTDTDNQLVFSPFPESLTLNESFTPQKIFTSYGSDSPATEIAENNYFYNRNINSAGWRIYALMPTQELLILLQTAYVKVSMVVLVLLSLFLTLAHFLSNKLSRDNAFASEHLAFKSSTEIDDIFTIDAESAAAINEDGLIDNEKEQKLVSSDKSSENIDVETKQLTNRNADSTLVRATLAKANLQSENKAQLESQQALSSDTNQSSPENNNSADAYRDKLTSLLNQSGFLKAANIAVKTSCRHNQAFSLAIFDINKFEEIGEQYGTSFADKCVRSFAALLQRNLKREIDLIGRLSDSEFVILVSGNDAETHHNMLRNIHQQTLGMQHKIPDSQELFNYAVSAGICTVLGNITLSYEEVFKHAEQELMKSKENGRNNVSITNYGYSTSPTL